MGWRGQDILEKDVTTDVYLRSSNFATLNYSRRSGNSNVHVGRIIHVKGNREVAIDCDVISHGVG